VRELQREEEMGEERRRASEGKSGGKRLRRADRVRKRERFMSARWREG
jgi:hypothetical protein